MVEALLSALHLQLLRLLQLLHCQILSWMLNLSWLHCDLLPRSTPSQWIMVDAHRVVQVPMAVFAAGILRC